MATNMTIQTVLPVGAPPSSDLHYNSLCDNSSVGFEFGNNCTVPPTDTGNGLKLIFHEEIWTPEVIQRIVMLSVIMTLTLFGNFIIIIVLSCSKYRKVNSRVNIFIINLAIGDLTVCCFTMTTEVLFVVFEGAWILGAAACKILLYLQIITLASTTFILTAMSFDRFTAICRPLSLGSTNHRAGRMIAASWILAFICASPQLLIFKQVPAGIYPDGVIKYKCSSKGYTAWWQRKLYFTFMTSYILVIPAILISFCYINVVRVVWKQGKQTTKKGEIMLRRTVKNTKAIPKAKVKTIKMTLSIICSFIACWTPYFVVHLIHIWTEYTYEIPGIVYVFAETAALLNSALNPILYGCFNIKLKRGLTEVFCPNRVKDKPFSSRYNMSSIRMSTLRGSSNCNSKAFSTRCLQENSSSSGGREDFSKDFRSREYISQDDSKNGYKLKVRFTANDREPTVHPEERTSLLAQPKNSLDSKDRYENNLD